MPVAGEALIIEFPEMIPGTRRDIAGQWIGAKPQVIVVADLSNDPWRIVHSKGQTMIVAQLRISGAGSGCVAVKDRDEACPLIRQACPHAHTGHRDRGRRAAGRKVRSLDRRPAERAVDEEIVGLAVEEFYVGSLLADPDGQLIAPKSLLKIGFIYA